MPHTDPSAAVGRPRHDPTRFAPGHRPPDGLVVLVGGVAELFQTDLDLGRLVVGAMADDPLPGGVYVEDLSYGAIPFTHRLMELQPHVLVLVGAVRRGRHAGSVRRAVVHGVDRTPAQLQGAVGDAYVGYVDLDLAVEVAHALDLLPPRTVLVEVEPGGTGPGEELTEAGRAALPRALRAVRREVALAALHDLHASVRARLDAGVLGPSPLRDALEELSAAIDAADATDDPDDDTCWGRVHRTRAELARSVSAHPPGVGMDHADWGMLWGLVEELERLRARTLLPDPDG